MAWHPEGNLIATSRGGPVIILDVDNLAVVTTIDTGLSAINELAWDPDGTRLAVATEAGEIVHIWGE
jgi:WD40 repeat protein